MSIPCHASSSSISQFRQDAAHIHLSFTVPRDSGLEHSGKDMGCLHKALVEEFQKKVGSMYIRSGTHKVGAESVRV